MGTRADFYIAHDKTNLEWLGSIAWDGYEIGDIGEADTQQDFQARVSSLLASRDDATLPERRFPWPWRDSRLTDCCYVWVDGIGVVQRMGDDYPSGDDDDYKPDDGKCDAYVSHKKLAELLREADCEGDVYHPLWDEENGFTEVAKVDTHYLYPDMKSNSNIRMDKGSGIILIGG